MSDIKKLYANLINAKEIYSNVMADAQQKGIEISNLKLEINKTKSRILEIERQLNNTRKGIGITLSADEFTSFKNEFEDKKNKLQSLNDLLPINERELNDLNKQNTGNSINQGEILRQITSFLANQAATDLAITSSDKLKELIYIVLANKGFYFSSGQDDMNSLYKEIGEKICKNLFAIENEPFKLPTIEKALAERDLLIENLA